MSNDHQLFRAEDNTALRFYTRPEKNNFQSEQHGREIFDTVLCVQVITPGSTQQMPEFVCERVFCEEAGLPPRQTEYYRRYQKQVEAFKANTGEYAVNGTPLSAWAQIDAGTVATLKAVGIQTVEQLAEVQDGHLLNLGIGGRTLRERAKQWITSREFGIPSAQSASEVVALREEVQRLQAENAQLRLERDQARAQMPEFGAPALAQGLGAVPAPPPPASALLASADALAAPPAPASVI